MNAIIYRDFSESYEIKEIRKTGKIKDVFPEYNAEKYAFIVNSVRQTGDYCLKDADSVIIRAIPGMTGIMIASAIVAGVAAVIGGVTAYKAKKQAEEAQDELEKIQNSLKTDSSSITNPMMSGAQNTVATGKTQPFVMGRRLFTPYLMTSEWDTMRGCYYIPAVTETLDISVSVKAFVYRYGGNRSGYTYKTIFDIAVTFNADWSGYFDLTFYSNRYNSTYGNPKLTGAHKAGETVELRAICSQISGGYRVSSGTFYVIGNGQTLIAQKYTDEGSSTSQHSITFSFDINTTITKESATYEKDNQQYVYRVLQQGFIKQAIEEIKADDETLIRFEEPVTELNKTIGSDIFSGSQIEVRQGGNSFETDEFTYKMDVQSVNDTLNLADSDDYEDLIYTLPTNAKSIYIPLEFGSGLYTTTDSGKKADRTIKTLVQYSTDGGENYSDLGTQFGQNGTITEKKRADLFFILNHDFTDAEVISAVQNNQPIKIKISCLTNESEGSAVDNMTVTKIRSRLCDSIKARAGTVEYEKLLSSRVDNVSVKIGLKLLTNESNKDKAQKIQVVSWGMARTWDSSTRTWSTEKTKTRNPAAWLLEVLTSDTHPASKVKDSEIDLESFGDFYEYCDTNALHVDYVITTGDTKENILKKILEAGNAALYRSIYGLMAVAIDDVKENAVAILNQQNIISFTAEKDLTRAMDGYRITFPVADTWKEDTKVFLRDGSDYDALEDTTNLNIEELTIDTFTANADDGDFSQVYKYARRKLNAEILRTHKYSVEIGKEGYYFPLYSRVKIQHPALYTGLGSASIKSLIVEDGKITGLKLFGSATYTKDARYGAIIQCVCADYSRLLNVEYTADAEGENDTIKFVTPIETTAQTVPAVDNILSFGTLGDDGSFKTITNEMTITEITPTTTGYRLGGVDYSDALFDYGTIPEYESNITQRRGTLGAVTVTKDDLLSATDEVQTTVTNSVINGGSAPSDVSAVSGIAEKDGINLSAVAGGTTLYDNVREFKFEISKDAGTTWESVSGSYYSFNRTSDGYPEKSAFVNYKVRCKAVNSYGLISENWTEGTVTASTSYGTWILNAPTVTAKAGEGKVEIAISDEVNANVWGYKSYSVTAGDYSDKITKIDEWNYELDISDLYLEKTDITAITFTATVKTEANEAEGSCTADVTDYLSYSPTVPVMALGVSGRNVSINFSHSEYYGFENYEFQISKDGSAWYSYGEDDTAFNNIDAWKGTADEATAITGSYRALVLPLTGEDLENPTAEDTTYYLRARTQGHTAGEWSTAVAVIVRSTKAYDIAAAAVKNAQIADYSITTDKIKASQVTANKIQVENLSAIQAYLGDVAAGSISSDTKTDESGATVPDPENSTLYLNSKTGEEEFYIGSVPRSEFVEGTEGQEALHFKTSGGVHSIIMQITNFIITSMSSIIKGIFKVRDKSGNDFITVNPYSTDTEDESGNTLTAKTMTVDGALNVTGNLLSPGDDATGSFKAGGANYTGAQSISIGKEAYSQYRSTAVGASAWAHGNYSVAIGTSATVLGESSIGIGQSAKAPAEAAVAMGTNAKANGKQSVVVGDNSIASSTYSAALGATATASGEGSVALGYYTTASGANSVAIGNGASATEDNTAVFASGLTVKADNVTVSGELLSPGTSSGITTDCFKAGAGAVANGSESIAIGKNAKAPNVWSLALGVGAEAHGYRSTAIGYGATTQDHYKMLDITMGSTHIYGYFFPSGTAYSEVATTMLEVFPYDSTTENSRGVIGAYRYNLCSCFSSSNTNFSFRNNSNDVQVSCSTTQTTTYLSYDLRFIIVA